MNQKSNNYLLFFASYILLPLAIAKLIWSGSLFFLDKDAIASVKEKDYIYHYNINLASSIIGTQKRVDKSVEVAETHSRLDDIKLKGTYVSDETSFIIIEDNLGTTFVYLNEKYVGYKLVKVYDKSAVLEKGGNKYDIVLESSTSKVSTPASDTSEPKVDNLADTQEEFIVGEPTQITRNELNSYVKNPNKIWKNIRIQEMRKDGQLNGFRVNYVKKGSFFQKAGLKSGDVIKSMDGKEIKSLADVMKYYSNIENMNGLSLGVSRGSEELELEFNVN